MSSYLLPILFSQCGVKTQAEFIFYTLHYSTPPEVRDIFHPRLCYLLLGTLPDSFSRPAVQRLSSIDELGSQVHEMAQKRMLPQGKGGHRKHRKGNYRSRVPYRASLFMVGVCTSTVMLPSTRLVSSLWYHRYYSYMYYDLVHLVQG